MISYETIYMFLGSLFFCLISAVGIVLFEVYIDHRERKKRHGSDRQSN